MWYIKLQPLGLFLYFTSCTSIQPSCPILEAEPELGYGQPEWELKTIKVYLEQHHLQQGSTLLHLHIPSFGAGSEFCLRHCAVVEGYMGGLQVMSVTRALEANPLQRPRLRK